MYIYYPLNICQYELYVKYEYVKYGMISVNISYEKFILIILVNTYIHCITGDCKLHFHSKNNNVSMRPAQCKHGLAFITLGPS